MTAYDPARCSLFDSSGNINIGSLGKTLLNHDGTADVYFWREALEDKKLAKNWVKTNPSKRFFAAFRFYVPMEGFMDKRWKLNAF